MNLEIIIVQTVLPDEFNKVAGASIIVAITSIIAKLSAGKPKIL